MHSFLNLPEKVDETAENLDVNVIQSQGITPFAKGYDGGMGRG